MRSFALLALLCMAGCGKQLFPDSMSPTQLQERQFNDGRSNCAYYEMDEGDNEDPCVDNAAYPDMSNPWWNSPGYSPG
jgi:hypothetical protein